MPAGSILDSRRLRVRRSASSGECNADNLRDRHASTMASYLLARDRWFESASPRRRVRNEPASGRTPNPLGFTVGTPYDGGDELWAAVAQLYAPINQITQSWGLIAGARVGARRIFDVLDTEADLKDGTRSFPAEGACGDIAWRHVSFRYRPETPVLNGVELRVPAGAKIAVIGPTGAGKSTLLGLLPRFFDPSSGVVEVDGVDLREYKLKSLRSQISMVLQPPLIFPLSVRDNIAYRRPGAPDAEIEKAGRLARIHDFFVSPPGGVDTVIGET